MNWSSMNTSFMTAGLGPTNSLWVKKQTEQTEALLSRFNPNSEVRRFNRGEAPSHPIFWSLFQQSLHYFEETDHLFQPFLGQSLCTLGYDRSFESLDPPKNTRTLSYNTGALDFGGIAKGWIAQSCFQRLYACGIGNGLIDAGGDIILWGQNNDSPWLIGIAAPLQAAPLACLSFHSNTGIATSSTQKRRWTAGENQFHHIIDPQTNHSSHSDCIQATVLASSLTDADVYAKVILLKGCQQGPRWLQERRPDLACILVSSTGAVYSSSNLDRYCSKVIF